ncbi:MAG: TraR/DksA family transcriptional regulator [Actinomycetota bacterium]
METVELEKFRKLLQEERNDARHQLTEHGADPDADSFEGMDFDFGFADSAQSTAERNRVLAVIEGLRERLVDIESAIGKLDRGTFGLCERCGKPIAPERLEALPHTRLCAQCKSGG